MANHSTTAPATSVNGQTQQTITLPDRTRLRNREAVALGVKEDEEEKFSETDTSYAAVEWRLMRLLQAFRDEMHRLRDDMQALKDEIHAFRDDMRAGFDRLDASFDRNRVLV